MATGVRRGGRSDVEVIVSLWSESIRHHARLDPHYRLTDGAEVTWRDHLVRLLRAPGAAVFVHECDGAAGGFAVVETTQAAAVLSETVRAEITDLYVRPDARRRGFGSGLVEASLAWAAEQGALRVEVRVVAGNAEGQAFWRTLGFADFVDVLQLRL
ncbi:MAG: GNAT family N-acetyltransferase [Myxococcota bacterium]|nr:GNAT family N-acetyltransferase [Myxococcota bacterium]MDP7074851.1 GNAT family N-acetyltransferase [Myxococcota bacterium]MDP7432207.1 GNAT family N-acetyltransferase [Myxococcota bacterium]MDP7571210.1 GNAT family N-acetyltransferase [Myxococcota bacterium]HJO22836.1 GNAT family N-acetyltransferase [Myxococcota bacterium]